MNYKYIYPLFDEEEVEEASDFIMERIISKSDTSVMKAMREGPDGDMEIVNLNEVPQIILKGLLGNLVFNAYGVNAPMMANYFRVEDTYLKDFESHILKYLDLSGFASQSISVDRKDLVLKSLGVAFMKPGFRPVSRWNPKEKWVSMEYTDNKDINLMNPINQCFATSLSIQSKNPNKYVIANKFIDMLDRMSYKYTIINKQESTGNVLGLRIEVLPARSYQPIIKLAQLIHKYF